MRKISLAPYMVSTVSPEGRPLEVPYRLRESLTSLLFQPDLKLQAPQLLKQEALANKIKMAGETLLLEDEEYDRLLLAVNTVQGMSLNEVELVKRVYDAEVYVVTPDGK